MTQPTRILWIVIQPRGNVYVSQDGAESHAMKVSRRLFDIYSYKWNIQNAKMAVTEPAAEASACVTITQHAAH